MNSLPQVPYGTLALGLGSSVANTLRSLLLLLVIQFIYLMTMLLSLTILK